MATRLAIATGNFTNAATWGVVDATALLVSSTNNTTLTTSYVSSSTFTPGAITIDGIAVWVNTRPGSTGTISVALDQATATVAGTEVAINVADIPASGNCWVFFKFAAPVLLLAATAYSVKAKTSSSTQVSLFRNSTAGNWSRLLRTTTTGAPAAGDDLYITGEKTGAGTANAITVTMDNTAATVFGLMDISTGGLVAYGLSAATAYLLTLAGNLNIRSAGEFNIGTVSGTRMPSDSSGELAFSNAANVDRGIEVIGNGIFRTAGAVIANPWALLAADAAATATSLTTDISTGWKTGDLIGIAPTTRTATESEAKALTADASGTTLTIAALTNAHGGSAASLVQAELINLTRNVKVHGTSATLQSYLNQSGTASIVEMGSTECYWMGSGTSLKRGIDVGTTTGSFSASGCAFRDFVVSNSFALNLTSSSVANVTVEDSVFFNIEGGFVNSGSSQTSVVFDNCVFIRTPNTGLTVPTNHTLTSIRLAGCTGVGIDTGGTGSALNGTWSNFVVHSNVSVGFDISSLTSGTNDTISNVTVWRCNSYGLRLKGTASNYVISGLTLFGNTPANLNSPADSMNITIKDFDIRAGAGLTCPVGYEIDSGSDFQLGLFFVNGSFGGGGQTHATADISIAGLTALGVLLDYCVLNSPTEIQNQSNMGMVKGRPVSVIRANFYQQTASHKTWLGNGTWSYDATIFDVSPSLRLTPLSASVKLQSSPGWFRSVPSGGSKTASVKVRKSVLGDGAAYNGAQPRLIVRRDYGAGITADTVLDTATAAADGAFETLSGTAGPVNADCALEFFVDCDGTAGWVNVDTVTFS